MKICVSCKKLYADEQEKCPLCLASLEVVKDDTPVALLEAEGFETERIKAALTDADIPFSLSYTESAPETMSAQSQRASIIVPYMYFKQSVEVCIGIGALAPDCSEAQFAQQTNTSVRTQEENMSRAKRTTVKIASAIAFLLLVAAVVFATDFVTGLIKGLFN